MKFIVFALFVFHIGFSQNTVTYQGEKINELAFNNSKTGLWKLYDHERGIVVSSVMKDDAFVSDIEYSQYGKIVATQKGDEVIIYKNDQKVIGTLQFANETRIVDAGGKEIDLDMQKLYFSVSSLKPMFYGGNVGMRASIMNTIDKSQVKGHKGKVNIKFVIDNDGIVGSAEVTNSNNAQLNEEALRLVKKLPRFQPGFLHGRFVRVEFAVPITF